MILYISVNLFDSCLIGFKVNEASNISIITTNAEKYTTSNTQNIEVPRSDDLII